MNGPTDRASMAGSTRLTSKPPRSFALGTMTAETGAHPLSVVQSASLEGCQLISRSSCKGPRRANHLESEPQCGRARCVLEGEAARFPRLHSLDTSAFQRAGSPGVRDRLGLRGRAGRAGLAGRAGRAGRAGLIGRAGLAGRAGPGASCRTVDISVTSSGEVVGSSVPRASGAEWEKSSGSGSSDIAVERGDPGNTGSGPNDRAPPRSGAVQSSVSLVTCNSH